mgnify:CR=1 FL=1
MKVYEIKMRDFLKDKVQQPIRGKRDIILLLLETIKMFGNPEGSNLDVEGKIMICIDKMSRVFYETQDKYFSFLFPFSVEQQENRCRFYDSLTECELNEKMISLLISIFRQDGLLEDSLEKAMDTIMESAEEYEYMDIDTIWRLIFKLWYMEDGYIRYDYDPEHEDGDRHPLHHLDINYSSGSTYKIGLKSSIKVKEFQNMMDIKTDCVYLSI